MPNQPSLFDVNHPPKPSPRVQAIDPINIHKDAPGLTLPELIPEKAALEVMKHYEPRAMYIGRFLAELGTLPPDTKALSRAEIGKRMGLNKSLSEGTFSAMGYMLLVDKDTHLTPFGELVKAKSPYLDDTGLLWFLHYLLASNAKLVLWSNLFNFVFFLQAEVTNQEILDTFRVLQGRWSENTITIKLPQEANAILKTYTEALFAPLGLVSKEDKALYNSYWNTANIPIFVWLAVLLVFRDRYYPGAASLEIPLLINSHYSPGRILRHKEAPIRQAMDALHNAGLLTVETRSGLDQVRFKRETTWLSAITRHLGGEGV
jgi:hypothetical protein